MYSLMCTLADLKQGHLTLSHKFCATPDGKQWKIDPPPLCFLWSSHLVHLPPLWVQVAVDVVRREDLCSHSQDSIWVGLSID